MTEHTACGRCGEYVFVALPEFGSEKSPLLALDVAAPHGPHALTCAMRVTRALVVVRPKVDHVQKLIPAAAVPRAPITIKAKR